MLALLSGLPILVVLALMLGLRWPAARAGVVGAGLALLIALGTFGLGRDVLPEAGIGGGLTGILAEATFTSATILWIVLPALAIHHLQVGSGATETLRVALGRLSDDPRILALLIGWFFALFIEGAAGFGASVALAAPFLVGLGYRPLEAVVVAMIGHAVGVSFGAIGTPIVPMVAATDLSPLELSSASATYHVLFGWLPLAVMVVVASRGTGTRATGAIWGWTALAGAAFLVPMWLLARFVGPELPTLAGALIGVATFVVALVLARRRAPSAQPASTVLPRELDPNEPFPVELGANPDHEHPDEAEPATDAASTPQDGRTAVPGPTDQDVEVTPGGLLLAGAPYLALIVLVVATRTVPVIAEPLGRLQLTWELTGGFTGSFSPLTHPGTLLVVSLLGGAAIQRLGRAAIATALRTTLKQLVPVTIALLAMLLLARTMVRSGMTDALAEAAAGSAGAAWPLLAPLVGVLGTFVTGSATASNVLFTDLQSATAQQLGLPEAPLLGAQNFGAGVGNAVCPHNIVAAGATVGLVGAEGDVLRRTLGVTLVYALLGGAAALVLT